MPHVLMWYGLKFIRIINQVNMLIQDV